jgi:DNA recombination protein RmuC
MSLLRDQRMREQAHVIREEVVRLMEDVVRLDDRVRKLQMHFGQANKAIDEILVSAKKVTGRGQRIEAVEFADAEPSKPPPQPRSTAPPRRPNGPPQLPFSQFEEV